MHGLSIETYNKIKYVLNKYPECHFKLFGSRAKGTYKYNSDIDLAVINNISHRYNYDEYRKIYLDVKNTYISLLEKLSEKLKRGE